MKKYTFLLLFLLATFSSQSQVKALYNQSMDAYKSKDYPLFLKLTKQLDSIRPSHPTFSYNLAAAYALNKKEKEAITALKALIVMNSETAFEEDADFEEEDEEEVIDEDAEEEDGQVILVEDEEIQDEDEEEEEAEEEEKEKDDEEDLDDDLEEEEEDDDDDEEEDDEDDADEDY